MAELVVCCDGTWNTPDDLDGGLPAPTNVVKLYHALAEKNKDGPQTAYYHPGVGTDGSWWNRIAGGGMGEGLEKNVESAYRWLAGVYRRDDRIWLFGFSRGAFTVRSLSGMISRCGLLDLSGLADDPKRVWESTKVVFDAYRARGGLTASDAMPFHNAAAGEATAKTTPIHFIGVWDTVGALGVPDDMALLNLIDDPARYEFHDTNLSDAVVHARHAVAMDEKRQSFEPTLWVDNPPPQDLKQVWFPGVHSDVGGGYGRAGLSDGALGWMMDEAAALGLKFRADARKQVAPDHRDVLHDSVTGVFKALKTRPRAAPAVAKSAGAALHESALARQKSPPLTQGRYWPTERLAKGASQTFDIFAQKRWNTTGLYLEKGVTYRFEAKGEWLDSSIPAGPAGTRDGSFHIAEVVHIAASALGKLEGAYKRLTGNPQADFTLTRRQEEFDWFALVGMVANGWKPQDRPKERPNETFLIGEAATFTPQAGGYLYCFANDAWQTYDNNRGSVRLTVSRT